MQYLLVTSRSSCCQVFPQGIHLIARLQCSALRLSPTMASADFSQFVVTAADGTACETSRDKSSVFPRLPARFTRLGYGCLLDFAVLRQLIRQTRLISGFCSSGYDFAIPSSRLHLTVQTLGVALGFVGNYAPYGLSPQTDGMPVIRKKIRKHFILCLRISRGTRIRTWTSGFGDRYSTIKLYPYIIKSLPLSKLLMFSVYTLRTAH